MNRRNARLAKERKQRQAERPSPQAIRAAIAFYSPQSDGTIEYSTAPADADSIARAYAQCDDMSSRARSPKRWVPPDKPMDNIAGPPISEIDSPISETHTSCGSPPALAPRQTPADPGTALLCALFGMPAASPDSHGQTELDRLDKHGQTALAPGHLARKPSK